jgi:hypothetical protein
VRVHHPDGREDVTVMTKAEKTEVTRTGKRASEATEPPWNVVLHNDRNPINLVVWRLWRNDHEESSEGHVGGVGRM